MATALRIILGFLAILVFVGIIFVTFFSQPSYLSVPQFPQHSEPLVSSWSSYSVISGFESVHSKAEFSAENVSSSWTTLLLNISAPGKYISSLRDTRKEYHFDGKGFTMQQEWIGEVFIDSATSPWKVFVYSLNTPLTITLNSDDQSEKYVDIYLNPHMYLEFTPSRWKYLKNADRIRIGTVFKLGYVWSWFWDEDAYIKKYLSSTDDFFNTTVSSIHDFDSQNQKVLSELSSQKVSQIPGYDMIQRYVHLFVNDEKKVVFYQNKVLEWYINILNAQKVKPSMFQQIEKDLDALRVLDSAAYETLIQMQTQMNIAVNGDSREEYIIPKMLFASFGNPAFSENFWYFPVYGFSLFSNYDTTWKFSDTMSEKFLDAFSAFNNSFDDGESARLLRYDYFVYYIEKQLLYLLRGEEAYWDIASITVNFEDYVNISLQNEDNDKIAKVSRLFVFADIFASVEVFLRDNYFLSKRTDEGLLELDSKHKMTSKQVKDLEKYVNTLYGVYEEDKKYLDEENARDSQIIKSISSSQESMKEYFLALENYQAYRSEYNVSKQNLLNLDTFSNSEDSSLTRQKIQEYLSQFVGISFENTTISVEDDVYYQVEGLRIWGKEFSFDVFPSSEYKLSNIYIDGVKKPIQYKLSKIEEEWEEKYQSAPNKEKEKYDFSRFFLLTFFERSDAQIEEYVNTVQATQEDKTEIVFKKDVLLGNPWEFTVLKDNFFVEYSDITLQQDGQNYNIFLDDVDFQLTVEGQGGRNLVYKWILTSEYVLSNIDHYFKGVELQMYKKYNSLEDGFLFDGNSIHIWGKIHISDIREALISIVENIPLYDNVYSEIRKNPEVTNTLMQYTLFNNKLSIKFDSWDKKYTILLRNDTIEGMYEWTKKLNSWELELSDIQTYIK